MSLYRWLRKEGRQGGGEGCAHWNADFQRATGGDGKAFLGGQCGEVEEGSGVGRTGDLFKRVGDIKGQFCAKVGTIGDGNGGDLAEADEIERRWRECTGELYKAELDVPGNRGGAVTGLEPDILACEVRWALESITSSGAGGGDSIPAGLLEILEDGAVGVLHSMCQRVWRA